MKREWKTHFQIGIGKRQFSFSWTDLFPPSTGINAKEGKKHFFQSSSESWKMPRFFMVLREFFRGGFMPKSSPTTLCSIFFNSRNSRKSLWYRFQGKETEKKITKKHTKFARCVYHSGGDELWRHTSCTLRFFTVSKKQHRNKIRGKKYFKNKKITIFISVLYSSERLPRMSYELRTWWLLGKKCHSRNFTTS